MENCVANHQLLNENYIVQPVENIPVSMIDYEKLEITQLIHSGQLTNGTPVIQLTDLNSNLKSKALHPLEVEIQRDFELKQQKQQQVLTNHSTSSVKQCPSQDQARQDQCVDKSPKVLGTTSPLFNGVMQLQTICDGRATILNFNSSKTAENVLCHISPVDRQLAAEKRQFIIVSDSSVLFNLTPKEAKVQFNSQIEQKEISGDIVRGNELLNKPEMADISLIIDSYDSGSRVNEKKTVLKSDSEDEEDDIQPVCDYEPDPDITPKMIVEQVEKPNKCYMCFKSFRQKKNMYAHIRKIHSTQPKIEGGILCPLCKMHALRQEHLRNHLETLHEIRIEKEEKLFNTMEEFLSWKEFTERETLSFYVSKSSSKLLANNQQKTYYKCHRSGHYITHKKENCKKKLKLQGSNKIGATCPAAMEVTENIHGINVTYWKTHVGHNNDLAHLVLTKEDRAKIMEYMISGTSWDKILEKIKKEGTKATLTPSRLTVVSKQDLRNIKKIHDIKNSPELYATRKKNLQGRKPIKEKMLRRASQSLVIEKALILLNLLETTDVRPEFRPKICLMIDNLISTVKRRAIKIPKREIQKKKQWIKYEHSKNYEEKEQQNKYSSNSNQEERIAKKSSGRRTSRRHAVGENTQKKLQELCC